ncbi:hypothetical protein C8J57DRAFT_1722353 [Mycena rebaudengoi]|nr:hypothetical protein C8J57DRAFT_1722353 [Mycena rebaudengoi]
MPVSSHQPSLESISVLGEPKEEKSIKGWFQVPALQLTNIKFSTAFFALVPLVAALPPAAVHTEAVANSKVGPTPNTQGNVFLCQDAGFHTNCQVLHGVSGACVNVPASLNDVISSFGPDSGQGCFIFESQPRYQRPLVHRLGRQNDVLQVLLWVNEFLRSMVL